MAKQQAKQKRASSKHIHAASLIKKDMNNQLIKLIAAAIGGVAIWALYTFVIHDLMPNTMIDSAMVFITALALVFFIGEVGNKYARFSAEYRKAKNEWGVTDEDVKAHMSKM